jgi:hypothetical protein
MINIKLVTQKAEEIFKENLGNDYHIERNPVRPSDPAQIARLEKDGWIGIYKDAVDYEGLAVGAMPWLVKVKIVFEAQVVSLISREDCENKLADAEKDILDLLEANRNLGNTIDTIKGYSVSYQMQEDEQTYYQAVLITIDGEART